MTWRKEGAVVVLHVKLLQFFILFDARHAVFHGAAGSSTSAVRSQVTKRALPLQWQSVQLLLLLRLLAQMLDAVRCCERIPVVFHEVLFVMPSVETGLFE
jgi:hypothetical protein